MPDQDVTIIELVNRMAGIEARLKSNEDKTDRIESLLHGIGDKLGAMSQTSDDRVEKIIADKTEAIKDQQREAKTKIESLEGGRRYNLVSVACVCGALFTMFTWFNNQSSESTRQLVLAENNASRSENQAKLNEVHNELEREINQSGYAVSQISNELVGFPEWKGLVTQQNATSIQDRVDQKSRLDRLETNGADRDKALRGLEANTTQKFTEVETQFNADGQVRNIQFSDQQRINGIMWNSVSALGGKMPDYPRAPFFQPNVSQQRNNDGTP
jgi:polyisoprenoid-binding protein YceI